MQIFLVSRKSWLLVTYFLMLQFRSLRISFCPLSVNIMPGSYRSPSTTPPPPKRQKLSEPQVSVQEEEEEAILCHTASCPKINFRNVVTLAPMVRSGTRSSILLHKYSLNVEQPIERSLRFSPFGCPLQFRHGYYPSSMVLILFGIRRPSIKPLLAAIAS